MLRLPVGIAPLMDPRSAPPRPSAGLRSTRLPMLITVLMAILTACSGVAAQQGGNPPGSTPLAASLPSPAATRPAAPAPTVSPTPSPASTPSPRPTDRLAPTPSAQPTLAPTPSAAPTPNLDPAPAAGPFSMDLDREGAFVSQATSYWCVAAAMHTMINIVDDGPPDGRRRTQAALYELGREHSTETLSERGVEPEGWAEGLNLSGAGPYVVEIVPTRRRAIHVAAEAMRLTGRPVGLVVWRGAHSWVMSGFEATADPAYTRDFEVTGIYVQDVWYPRVSSIWGHSPEPGSLVPVERLSEDFLQFRRPTEQFPDRDGQFVLILPTLPEAIPTP